jgi:predicted MFS family arabinose efflux permease
VRSLRRFWATAFALSVAAFGMFSLASLYFEQEFDFGPQARGFVQFVIGVGWIGGVWLGGLMADRRVGEERFEQLAVLCGNAFVLFVVGGLGLAVAPTSWVAVLFVGVLAAGNGVWQSPYFSAVGRIAPAGLSGQAFASSVLVYALGGFGALAIGIVADASTLRIGFVLVAAAGLAASVLARSVAPLIRADLAAAPESPPARCA